MFWPDASVSAADGGSVGELDRLDHAVALILGGSSPLVAASSPPWTLEERVTRFSGVALTSFGLAYALPLVGAVDGARSTARKISALAPDDGGLEDTSNLDGADQVLPQHLVNLTDELNRLSQQIYAYPILPFFHADAPGAAIAWQRRSVCRWVDQYDADDPLVPPAAAQPLERALGAVLDVYASHCLPSSVRDSFPDGGSERRAAVVELWNGYDGRA